MTFGAPANLDSAHQSVSGAIEATGSSPQHVQGHAPRNFRGPRNGNFRGQVPKPLAWEITQNDWNRLSGQAFKAYMKSTGFTAKQVARELGCSDRTVDNYVEGLCAPAGLYNLRAIAVVPEYAALVRRASGMTDTDPEFERAQMDLVRAAMSFAERMGNTQ